MAVGDHTLSEKHLWSRRGWLSLLGWGGVLTSLNITILAFLRFMYPRVLFEPSPMFKAGTPGSYLPGVLNETYRNSNRVWIARTNDRIVAILAICTHLGCTPRWLAAENKFKCPCHGSGFQGFGPGGTEGELAVNFEGPAPRPLERLKIGLSDDGEILIDKSAKFLWEKDEWNKPGSYLEV